ncbi:ABC transporter permease [uncultured Aliivibrio sp.]|uniref:ABC transporter permease n=1 Tax=uncultured Aliivibrio sp. TaxID=873085 RepID=UPI0026200574|nr:ABC transporter permease [uncultured Aliivibrio sp.]
MSVAISHSSKLCINLTRLVVQLCLALILITLLLALSPIDPISAYFDGNAFTVFGDRKEQLTEQLGLNQSAIERISLFIQALLSGDLGYSNHYQEAVSDIIWQRSKYSLILMCGASAISLILGYVLGLLLGLFPNKRGSKIMTQLALIMNALPSFWIGLMLIAIFSIKLMWLPIGGISPLGIAPETLSFNEKASYFVLPLITLCLSLIAPIILHTKEKVIEVNNSEHVHYARLHGQSTLSVVRYHLLRNTMVPALVIQLAGFSELLSGSVIIETVFNFPGIGQTLVKAGLSGDTPLLLGITFCCAIFVFIGNATASLLSKKLSLSSSF